MNLYKEEIKLTVTVNASSEKMSLPARAGWALLIALGMVVSVIWMIFISAMIIEGTALVVGSPIAVLAGHGSSLEHRIAEIDLIACGLLAAIMFRLWVNDPY